MRRHSSLFRLALACGVLGLALMVLGAALVASRRSSERDGEDRTLQTTATEKAALVQTELERGRALALVTARIRRSPQFDPDVVSALIDAITSDDGPGPPEPATASSVALA